MKNYIGIDIGGSFIKYGLIHEKGTVLFHEKKPTRRENPEWVLDDLVEIIDELNQQQEISGVGISIPGVINREGRMVTSGALVDLYTYDVRRILQERTGQPIYLVNDAKAIGYAENWLGNGKICENFVCVPLGTGVGGSIIIDGKVIQGRVGAAGEFGLMLMGLGKTDPVGYESASFYCGAVAGLCRMYSYRKGLVAFNQWETDIRKIMVEAKEGQQDALDSLADFYQNVAVLLLNITVSLDPERIVVGGGISENQELMEGIRIALKELLYRYKDITAIGLPEVLASQLGNQAGMIGAVAHFIEKEGKENAKNGKIY